MRRKGREEKVLPPWIVCRNDIERGDVGEGYIPLGPCDNGKFIWEDILSTFSAKGVGTLVIAGDAIILNDLLGKGFRM